MTPVTLQIARLRSEILRIEQGQRDLSNFYVSVICRSAPDGQTLVDAKFLLGLIRDELDATNEKLKALLGEDAS